MHNTFHYNYTEYEMDKMLLNLHSLLKDLTELMSAVNCHILHTIRCIATAAFRKRTSLQYLLGHSNYNVDNLTIYYIGPAQCFRIISFVHCEYFIVDIHSYTAKQQSQWIITHGTQRNSNTATAISLKHRQYSQNRLVYTGRAEL